MKLPTSPQGEVSVAVVHSVAIFALQEAQNVVLDNWVLGNCCVLCAGRIASNAIAESKDVLVFLVLKSVPVHINKPVLIAETRFSNNGLWLAWWVNASGLERSFNNFSIVNVAENSNLLANLSLLDFNHFPAEHHINAALVALVQRNLVGISEPVNLLIWCPELDSCALR
jgi:hypothetical protein